MRIARLNAKDAPAYRELMLFAYASEPEAFTSTAEERAAQPETAWTVRLADPKGLSEAFGAFEGEELFGAVTLEYSDRVKTRHKVHLVGMFVRESVRRSGAGRGLVAAALKSAAARPGAEVVTLTATEGNVPAIRLYELFGFKAFGVEPMAVATPRGYLAKVHMWLRLPKAGADAG